MERVSDVQCAGCGFYRPDPPDLPAAEDHIRALKADREMAEAMDTDAVVIRNLTDQVEALAAVSLVWDEEVEQAATSREWPVTMWRSPSSVTGLPSGTRSPCRATSPRPPRPAAAPLVCPVTSPPP